MQIMQQHKNLPILLAHFGCVHKLNPDNWKGLNRITRLFTQFMNDWLLLQFSASWLVTVIGTDYLIICS